MKNELKVGFQRAEYFCKVRGIRLKVSGFWGARGDGFDCNSKTLMRNFEKF